MSFRRGWRPKCLTDPPGGGTRGPCSRNVRAAGPSTGPQSDSPDFRSQQCVGTLAVRPAGRVLHGGARGDRLGRRRYHGRAARHHRGIHFAIRQRSAVPQPQCVSRRRRGIVRRGGDTWRLGLRGALAGGADGLGDRGGGGTGLPCAEYRTARCLLVRPRVRRRFRSDPATRSTLARRAAGAFRRCICLVDPYGRGGGESARPREGGRRRGRIGDRAVHRSHRGRRPTSRRAPGTWPRTGYTTRGARWSPSSPCSPNPTPPCTSCAGSADGCTCCSPRR